MRDYRLLIVDDDAIDRRLYTKLLHELGPDTCHVQQAADGATGLAMLRADTFDCVLLDFRLPDMTGLEFLNTVVVDGELPCAVVLVTGQGNEAVAVQAMKRGVQDYLVKDQVNAASLWRTMTQAVTKTELQQRLAGTLRDLTAANQALEQEATTRTAAEAAMRIAKEHAEQASQAKTRFVAMMTHELRTPLNGVLGYAQLLRLEGGLSSRQDGHIGAMIQAGRHLLSMIERVLDFASIESAHMVLQPEVVSVRALTEDCVALISPLVTERGLGLRVVNAYDAPPHIVADPARLRQVVLNLLGNAVKYTDAGSVELRVLAGAAPGGLRIEVADTGHGIDPASRDRLFQDFERLEAATTVEGAGLGLAIAARIVRLMGGTIDYAANPGGGSLFWLELPPGGAQEPVPEASPEAVREASPDAVPGSAPQPEPAQAAAAPQPAPVWEAAPPEPTQAAASPQQARDPAPAPPAGEATSKRPATTTDPANTPARKPREVLLVDDIKINRDIIGAFLDSAGHKVAMAEGGEEAVRLAAEKRYDVILMDVRMPRVDGLEATRRIRALPGLEGRVPILALTAYTFPDQVAQCIEVGMDGHLPKPVDYKTLVNGINEVIARVATDKTRGGPTDAESGLPGDAPPQAQDRPGDPGADQDADHDTIVTEPPLVLLKS